VGVDAPEQAVEVGSSERPLERASDLPVVVAEAEQPLGELLERVEVVRGEYLALDDREVELDLLSQEAWIGRWISRAFFYVLSIRSIEALPAWELPLSTIKKTVRAER
jgi:hypothetical protein